MRADRLIALMLLLHARGRTTAQDLSELLQVSERTIYRDLDALSLAGVPIFTQSGPNGGVSLDEHYRISLTGLSLKEAQALFISNDADPLKALGLANTTSLLKLFAALPTAHRTEVERMRQRFHVDSANWFQIVEPLAFLPVLQQAVWEDQRIEVEYQPVEGQQGPRLLDAYALVAKANIWYLVGKKPEGTCDDMHMYRIARFQQVTLTGAHFDRDPGFDLVSYWREACMRFEQNAYEAMPPFYTCVRVHPDSFWIFPAQMEGHYERLEPTGDGWISLRVRFRSFDEARRFLMKFGADVDIVEPETLRYAVIETARQILAHYKA